MQEVSGRGSNAHANKESALKKQRHKTVELIIRHEGARKDNKAMSGIQFVTDEKGRKVAVQIDLKRYGRVLEDFWDGLISESRRKEKGIPLEKIKAELA